LAVVLIGAGAGAGPLLLADGRVVAGIAVCALGLPVAFAMVRSLHSLARRFLVLVPAGVVVVDPLTLADPVLMRREQIARIGHHRNGESPQGALDLRLGSRVGTIEITLREPQSFARRRGRHDVELCDTGILLVAAARAAAFVTTAGDRRIATA
jgi:hypothetical protein